MPSRTDIENKILFYLAGVFGVVYYILVRLVFTYRLQKHLALTVPNYQFKWSLWYVNWKDEALQQAWKEKLQAVRKRGDLTNEKHLRILHTYQCHNTAHWAYAGLFLLIVIGIFCAFLLATTKSHHKLTEFNRNRRLTSSRWLSIATGITDTRRLPWIACSDHPTRSNSRLVLMA